MKKLVSIVILLLGGVGLVQSHDLPGWPGHPHAIIAKQETSIEIMIPGLVCESCAIGIKKKLSKVFSNTIVQYKFNTKKQTCNVYIPSPYKIDNEAIKKAVKDAGYKVKWIKVRKVAIA